MRKGKVFNLFAICLVFNLAFVLFLNTACYRNKAIENATLEVVDTITLPFKNAQAWKIYYHPLFQKTVLTFFQESPLEIVLIDPETMNFLTFPLDKINNQYYNLSYPLAHYVIDSSSAIVNFLNMKDRFFKIDRGGNIVSIIHVDDQRAYKDYGIYYYSSIIPFPKQNSQDTLELVENFTADFPGNHKYITDIAIRNRKFSAKTHIVIHYCDTSIWIIEEIGNYPDELINSPNYYYYEPAFCISDNNQVTTIFPSINKIGYTLPKAPTEFHNLKIPNTSAVSSFDSEAIMDYSYLNRYTYENSILRYIYSNSLDDTYYVISSVGSKYINDDGTKNVPSSSPWVLVTMDASGKNIRTDFFYNRELSKHNFFFSSKYLFIKNDALTHKNPDRNLTFIVLRKPNKL